MISVSDEDFLDNEQNRICFRVHPNTGLIVLQKNTFGTLEFWLDGLMLSPAMCVIHVELLNFLCPGETTKLRY